MFYTCTLLSRVKTRPTIPPHTSSPTPSLRQSRDACLEHTSSFPGSIYGARCLLRRQHILPGTHRVQTGSPMSPSPMAQHLQALLA